MSVDLFQNGGADILGRVSGPLRAQLETLRLALEALAPPERRDASPALDRHAAALNQAYYRLLRLSGNLAGLGREVQLQNGDVAGLARETVLRSQLPAEMLGLKLELLCARPSLTAAMDRAFLERLLLNLLSNAFRFTPKGGTVTLEVRTEGEWVLLAVTDTGPGLNGPVFGRYVPEGPAQPHGLGLGLPICREIAQAHGGSLVLSTKENGGTAAVAAIPNRKISPPETEFFPADLYGGHNHILVELADVLPIQAFTQRFLD